MTDNVTPPPGPSARPAEDARKPSEKLQDAIERVNQATAALLDYTVPRGEAEAEEARAMNDLRTTTKAVAGGCFESLEEFYRTVVKEANGLQGSLASVKSPYTVRNALAEAKGSVHLVQLAARVALRQAEEKEGATAEGEV